MAPRCCILAAVLAASACDFSSGGGSRTADAGADAAIDPVTVTVRQVQDPTEESWVAAGTWVRIEDVVVTARGNATDDFTVQDDRAGEAGWSGLYVAVDDPDGALAVPIQGDRVTLVGRVDELEEVGLPGSETRLAAVATIEVRSSGAPVPEPVAVAAADVAGASAPRQEELEGVLVRVAGPHEVVDIDPTSSDLAIAGGLMVGARFHAPDPLPGPGDVYAELTGPLGFADGAPHVLPRSEGDLAGLVVAAHITAIEPSVLALAPGADRTLLLVLDAPTPTALEVCLASSHPGVAAPAQATVTVPAGETEVELEVHAVSAAAMPATLRAWRASGPCATAPAAAVTALLAVTEDRIAGPGDLLFNEVLSDPPGTEAGHLDGDASCDGVRSSDDDEFLELVNQTEDTVDLSGVRVLDKLPEPTLRHVFDAGTRLAPGEAIVLLGAPPGAAASGPWCAALGAVKVASASQGTGLHLNNAGDTVTLQDAGGVAIATFQYSALVGAHDQSLTRDPDLTGEVVLYGDADGHMGDRAFSPGTRNDGTPFEVDQ
jgi:hypothetical protein